MRRARRWPASTHMGKSLAPTGSADSTTRRWWCSPSADGMKSTDRAAAPGNWSTQQLAEFLVAVAASNDERSARLCAMQWASEVLEAEVAAVVTADSVTDMIGFPRGEVPVAALLSAAGQRNHELSVPRIGTLRTLSVPVEEIDGHLIVARSGDDRFEAD